MVRLPLSSSALISCFENCCLTIKICGLQMCCSIMFSELYQNTTPTVKMHAYFYENLSEIQLSKRFIHEILGLFIRKDQKFDRRKNYGAH